MVDAFQLSPDDLTPPLCCLPPICKSVFFLRCRYDCGLVVFSLHSKRVAFPFLPDAIFVLKIVSVAKNEILQKLKRHQLTKGLEF